MTTFLQRHALRRLVKEARKGPGEPLSPEDWEAYFTLGSRERRMKRLFAAVPSSPRCGFCGAPFAGPGRMLRPLGYRPSRKNPNVCDVCVELAPPGGMTTDAGVLFADLRGFTAFAERTSPQEASAVLRRFYRCAEDVLFPDALIDKLIGDEVMALYIPAYMAPDSDDPESERRRVAKVMLDHARGLLGAVGYGGPEGAFADVGIGLDYGEAFVGRIGDGRVNDFTAIGDVVNTASRLQGQAQGGEIVASQRLLDGITAPAGERVELTVKGKAEPVTARRIPV
jgi:adenylate cyclase